MHLNLHSILQLRYNRTLGYEGKQLTLHSIRQRDNEQYEDCHFCHQEQEDLINIPSAWSFQTKDSGS